MSATITTVLAALETTIKGVTPTLESTLPFWLRSDDRELLGDESHPPDSERGFEVWPRGARVGESHGFGEYEVVQDFLVVVGYPLAADYREQALRLQQDVRDLKNALDLPSNWATDVLHQWVSEWAAPELDQDKGRWLSSLIVTVRYLEATSIS